MMKKSFLVFVSAAVLGTAFANPFELKPAKRSETRENTGYSVLGALMTDGNDHDASKVKNVEKKEEKPQIVAPKVEKVAPKVEESVPKVEDAALEEKKVVSNAQEAVPKVEVLAEKPKVKRPAKITAKKTFYDRKQGVAYFEGSVCVDDEQYKMNADKVYVFLDGTNDLRRIVAIGNVAMTNEMRRAYASKASYYKRNGMVVLDSGSGITAEVRDESKSDAQSVRGKKIKFWLSSEQVEVIDADITAPSAGAKGGLGSIKNDLLGK